MGAFKGMFSFFTMLRLDIGQEDMDAMDRSFHLVPFVGLFYGVILVISLYVSRQFVGPLVAASLSFFIIQAINRFLHMDGLMDVGDGLTVSGGREDHLRALKDTRIGAGAVATALLITSISICSLGSFPMTWALMLPLITEVMARNSMVAAAAFGIPGEGMAAASIRSSSPMTSVKSVVISLVLCYATAAVYWLVTGSSLPTWGIFNQSVLVITVLSLAIGWVMARLAHRNFGIVNGDVLGATNEVARALLLVVALAVI